MVSLIYLIKMQSLLLSGPMLLYDSFILLRALELCYLMFFVFVIVFINSICHLMLTDSLIP